MKIGKMSRVKVRPRSHIIAATSYHWLALLIVKLGHAIDALESDYGTDGLITTFNPSTRGLEPDLIRVQLKATDEVKYKGSKVKFLADLRDLRDWQDGAIVTILVVFDAINEQAWWLNIQDMLHTTGFNPQTSTQKEKTLYLSTSNVVDEIAIHNWRIVKNDRVKQVRKLL